MHVHAQCGAEVVMVVVRAGDQATTSSRLWGVPVLVDRMLRGGAELVFHQCRDYVDWHRAEPDRRDPSSLELPVGWQPAPLSPPLDPALPLPDVVHAA